MGLRTIITEGDDRLRKKCREVTEFNDRLHTLLDDLYQTMTETSNGVGIAAPQVGVLRRAVVVDIGESRLEFVNPVITARSGEQNGVEGCLSIPGEYGMVTRPQQITVHAQRRDGSEFDLTAEDYLAVAICHELDHLDGVLFTDRADRMLSPEELEDDED